MATRGSQKGDLASPVTVGGNVHSSAETRGGVTARYAHRPGAIATPGAGAGSEIRTTLPGAPSLIMSAHAPTTAQILSGGTLWGGSCPRVISLRHMIRARDVRR